MRQPPWSNRKHYCSLGEECLGGVVPVLQWEPMLCPTCLVMGPQISTVREPQSLLCPSAMGLSFIMDRVLASGAALSSSSAACSKRWWDHSPQRNSSRALSHLFLGKTDLWWLKPQAPHSQESPFLSVRLHCLFLWPRSHGSMSMSDFPHLHTASRHCHTCPLCSQP